MKGQYKIVSEILLFSIGIMITGYVIINFSNLQGSVRDVSLRDQLGNVADTVASAVVKAANTENSIVSLAIPDQISGTSYKISLKDAGGGKIMVRTLNGSIVIERQIFNINYDNTNINNNVINNSEVLSSAQFIQIVKNEKITIIRAALA